MSWILNREVSARAPYRIQMCKGLASLVCKPRPRTIPAGVTHHLPSAPHQGSWSSSSTNLNWWDPKRRASSCPVSPDTTALQPMLHPQGKTNRYENKWSWEKMWILGIYTTWSHWKMLLFYKMMILCEFVQYDSYKFVCKRVSSL